MNTRVQRSYATDLTDKEWLSIADILNETKSNFGRPIKISRREIINAIFYVIKTGCQWRLLPKCFGPWQTVYSVYRRWRLSGILQKIHDELKKN